MAKASIQFLGHSTVLITTEGGKRAMIDPWLDGNPSATTKIEDVGSLDYIFLTHGHSDHTGSAAALAKRSGATLCATYELAVLMTKEGVPEKQVQFMNKGGTVELPGGNGLKVTLGQAFHSSSFDASDGKTYYAGEPCSVIVHLESGRTIYHAGDTLLFGDMALIGEMYEPTVALLPIGDRFTMGAKEAARAAQLIKPKYVIPIHFKTFPLLEQSADKFVSECKESQVVVLEVGKTWEF